MIFLYDTEWWIAVAVALGAASAPAFMKRLNLFFLLAVLAVWTAVLIRMAFMQGALAALAGGMLSLFWGFLLMLFSLFYSGLRQMSNKRYG